MHKLASLSIYAKPFPLIILGLSKTALYFIGPTVFLFEDMKTYEVWAEQDAKRPEDERVVGPVSIGVSKGRRVTNTEGFLGAVQFEPKEYKKALGKLAEQTDQFAAFGLENGLLIQYEGRIYGDPW